jgi:aspartyl protease family protein
LILAIGLGLLLLATQLFPGQIGSGHQLGFAAGGAATAAYVGASVFSRGLSVAQMLRYCAIWGAVIAVLLLGYSYKDEIMALGGRVGSVVAPAAPVTAPSGELVIARDQDGGFYLLGNVNGQTVRFLADTGASEIVLSPADAERLGVDIGALQFGGQVETANGIGHGAPFTAQTLNIGTVQLQQVPMMVNQAKMSSSLLGMTFFNHLQSFRIEGDRLYLKPKP